MTFVESADVLAPHLRFLEEQEIQESDSLFLLFRIHDQNCMTTLI
jgi:hypothetical protein